MSASKHTNVRLEVIGNLVRTGREHGGYLVAECRDAGGLPHSDEAKANAVLFSAAPDLAFQLLCAANYIDALGGDSKSYRAAIAKATGSAS